MTEQQIVWSGAGADISNISNLNTLSASPVLVGYNLTGFLGNFGRKIPIEDDDYTKLFSDFAQKSIAKDGIFTNLAPDIEPDPYWGKKPDSDQTRSLGDGFVRSKFAYTYVNLDRKIGDRDTDLHHSNSVMPLVESYNKFIELFTKSQNVNVDFSKNNNANTFILGSTSNLDLKFGNGNNLIMTSPVMNVFLKNYEESGDRNVWSGNWNEKDYTNIFYPTAQGALHSNNLQLGNGNNLVYFDGSFKTIKTGDGNNVFAPSFGAFNWATNSAHYYDNPVAAGGRTLISPIPLNAIGTDKIYSEDNLYTFVFNELYDSYDSTKTKENGFQVYFGKEPSLKNNKENTVGGLRIVAGDGQDTFYGMDPSFYDTVPTDYNDSKNLLRGAERIVFDQPKDATNKRLSLQNYETVEMLGGGGNNLFYLGNPNHVSADGSQYTGRYSYLLSAAHSELGSEATRSKLVWGEGSFAVNTINVNLSANIETYILSSTSFDQDKGGSVNVYSAIKTGTGLANATNKYLDKVMNLSKEGGKVLKKLIPYADFAFSAVSAVTDTVQLISNIFSMKSDPEPIKLEEEQFRQPLGAWKQVVGINDWNPNLALNISVDPTLTTAGADLRWKNIEFKINAPGSSSEFQKGLIISYQQGSDTPKALFHLDGFGVSAGGEQPQYGYYSYDFMTGKNRLITQDDLAFMGTIAYGVKDINPLKDYQATNGFVFSSSDPNSKSAYGNASYSFYWNDRGFVPGTNGRESHTETWLQNARDAASSLTIQFDSRSFGWFWQPVYASTPEYETSKDPSDLTIDTKASQFWVELQPGQWTSYTFKDLQNKPLAFSYALLAKTFYQVNYGGQSLKPFDQTTSEKLSDSLKIVNKYFSDLSKLDTNLQSKILENVQQITFAKEGKFGAFSVDGLYIYSIHTTLENGKSEIVKGFIQKNGDFAQHLTASTISSDEYYKAEIDDQVDINLDGIIGRPSVKIVQDTTTQSANGLNLLKAQSSVSQMKFIDDLYQSALNRHADLGGLKTWSAALEKGDLTKTDVMIGLLTSDEFFNIQSSRKELITDLYEHFFSRDPDAAGLSGWLNAMDNGMSFKDIVIAFAHSNEFNGLVGVTSPAPAPAAALMG